MILTSATTEATTGLVGTIGMRVLDLPALAVAYARSTAGITEPVTGSGSYLWNGSVTATRNSAVIWDDGQSTPKYSVEVFGRTPVLQAPTGRTYSIEILDLISHLVITADTTVGIVEAISGSGIYVYQGSVPSTPYMVIWHDQNGHYVTDECRDVAASVVPPIIAGTESQPKIAYKQVGGRRTPQEVKRLRREVMDFCRKMGQSIVLKHQWNNEDVRAGTAKKCPGCFDSEYGQTRNDCPVCFAVGFVSVENDDITSLYVEDGQLVDQVHQVNEVRAPKYGGYGAGYITWMIEPDTPVDIFTINEQGVMVQTQSAQGVAPWFPELHDNDLAINVDLTDSLTIEHVNVFGDGDINQTYDRYQLKLTNPITLRGFGIRARQQDFKVQQTFEMAHIPLDNILYRVPLDR